MAAYNYILFQALSLINLCGGLAAIWYIWSIFGKHQVITKKDHTFASICAIANILMVIGQAVTLDKQESSYVWQVKLANALWWVLAIYHSFTVKENYKQTKNKNNMNKYWVAVPGDDTQNGTFAPDTTTSEVSMLNYISSNPGAAYFEYENDPTYHTNFVFESSASAPSIAVMVNGVGVNAELIGGAHSPQRPK